MSREPYVLEPCDKPIAVLPDEHRLQLGSGETNGLLFAVTYSGRDIYFNFSHNFCGASGAMLWVKTTLWQYLTDKGYNVPSEGIRLPGTPVTAEETAVPDLASLPADEPPAIPQAGNSVGVTADYMEMMRNPGSMGQFYYSISIEKAELMKYVRENDGSPNSILSALLFKTAARVFPEAGQLSGKIICNYRKDVGCPETHCDLVRFLRAIYQPKMKD